MRAPPDGFLFDTVPRAAPILIQSVKDCDIPVYTTSLPPPDSLTPLIPTTDVALWLQQGVFTGTMINILNVKAFHFTMTTPTMNVCYNEKGQWILTSGFVDYTKGRAAPPKAAPPEDESENSNKNQAPPTGPD